LLASAKKERRDFFLLGADMRFFLARLSQTFAGSDDLENKLPSAVQRMADRYMEIQSDM
jgi:hypothetical protein